MAISRLLFLLEGHQVKWNGITQHVKRCFHATPNRCNIINTGSGCRNYSYSRMSESRLNVDQEHIVSKDTILFKNDNTGFFKMMNVFAVSQFFFWSYLSHFAFTTMKDVTICEKDKANESLPWWRKTNFGQFRYGITIASFLIGWGTLAISWIYTLHSVRYLVLKKGGRDLLFITFAPINRARYKTVPLEKVSATQSRVTAKAHLPIKVQGMRLHYLLDMQGQFTNTKLFDYSAGVRRSWAK